MLDMSKVNSGMNWSMQLKKDAFACGNVHCSATGRLRSWEVNFAYKERGERRNALVKLRLCPPCSDKLNYRHK
ncbi:unnamed protein product [Echinostoma caproni]|uniref:HNH endonuclease n=1 Tax=Echinostoma caproni TaxID=27848 RepID=A0A182ZZV7_9TREM|nr:unnamed protein product [Echinostoma caproni]